MVLVILNSNCQTVKSHFLRQAKEQAFQPLLVKAKPCSNNYGLITPNILCNYNILEWKIVFDQGKIYIIYMSQDSSVTVVSGWGLSNWSSFHGRFSVCCHVQTSPVSHPATCHLSTYVKELEYEANHSPPSVGKVKRPWRLLWLPSLYLWHSA